MTTAQELGESIRLFASGAIKGNLPDTLGAPIDLINALSPKSIQNERPALGSKHLREMMFRGNQVEDANLAETAGSMFSAGGAVKGLIGGAALAAKLISTGGKSATGVSVAAKSKELGAIVAAERLGSVSGSSIDVAKGAEISTKHPEVSKASQFNLTGTYTGEDGALRAVISDKASKLLGSSGTTLSAVLDHPELYKLYPELKTIPIQAGLINGKAPSGSFNPKTGIKATAGTSEFLRDVILHETQHAIQNIDGFSKGGNIQQFLSFAPKLLQESITKGKNSIDSSVRDAADRFKNKANQKIQEAIKSYENLPGEQEARFTQATKDMDYAKINTAVYNLLRQGKTPQSFDTK